MHYVLCLSLLLSLAITSSITWASEKGLPGKKTEKKVKKHNDPKLHTSAEIRWDAMSFVVNDQTGDYDFIIKGMQYSGTCIAAASRPEFITRAQAWIAAQDKNNQQKTEEKK